MCCRFTDSKLTWAEKRKVLSDYLCCNCQDRIQQPHKSNPTRLNRRALPRPSQVESGVIKLLCALLRKNMTFPPVVLNLMCACCAWVFCTQSGKEPRIYFPSSICFLAALWGCERCSGALKHSLTICSMTLLLHTILLIVRCEWCSSSS